MRRAWWGRGWIVVGGCAVVLACADPPRPDPRLYRYVDERGATQFAQGRDNVPAAQRPAAVRVDAHTSTNGDLAAGLQATAAREVRPAPTPPPGCGPAAPAPGRTWRDRIPPTWPQRALLIGMALAAIAGAWALVRWVGGATWLRVLTASAPLLVGVVAVWATASRLTWATRPAADCGPHPLVERHHALDAARHRALDDALRGADGAGRAPPH